MTPSEAFGAREGADGVPRTFSMDGRVKAVVYQCAGGSRSFRASLKLTPKTCLK